MNEQRYTRIVIQSARPTTLYTEEETARYAHLEIQAIHRLRAVGLIEGIETDEGERRYSEEDVQRLRRIRRLRRDLGVNLAGAEVILELSRRLEELQRELEGYRRK
jgi:DNA-binding transcriptional MerR regulator